MPIEKENSGGASRDCTKSKEFEVKKCACLSVCVYVCV